jgi:hypothetical protein
MLKSSNDKQTDQSFALKIEQVKEGEFKATAKSFPKVPPVSGETVKQAAMRMNTQLQNLHRSGELDGKK